MSVLVILIIAAILHASWNAFVKDQNNGLVTVTIISSTMALLVLPLTFVVGLPSSEIWIYLLISVVAHTLYLHAMTRAYSLYDFSIAYPFARGLAPLITVLILIIFFNLLISFYVHKISRQWVRRDFNKQCVNGAQCLQACKQLFFLVFR